MLDKARLGTRYTCFQCGCRFYDLNRPEPTCPRCGADQREAPEADAPPRASAARHPLPAALPPEPDEETEELEVAVGNDALSLDDDFDV